MIKLCLWSSWDDAGSGKNRSRKEVSCEISLENRMACGVKACVGCSIQTVEGMKKVCHDGPVFDSKMIVNYEPKENQQSVVEIRGEMSCLKQSF